MRKAFKFFSVIFSLLTFIFAGILFFKYEVFDFIIFYALLIGSFSLAVFCIFMNSLLFRKALSKKLVCGTFLCVLCFVVVGCTAFGINAYNKSYAGLNYTGLNYDVLTSSDAALAKDLYPYMTDDRICDFSVDGIDGFCADISLYSHSHYSYYYKSKSPLMAKIYSEKTSTFVFGDFVYTQRQHLETNDFEKKTVDGIKVKVYYDKYTTVAVKIDTLTECFYTEYLRSQYSNVIVDDFVQKAVKQYKAIRNLGIDEYKAICEDWYAD